MIYNEYSTQWPKTEMTDTRVEQQQSASPAKSAADSESDTKNQDR